MGCLSAKAGKARVSTQSSSSFPTSKVTLRYFDLYGRAEVLRMLLKARDIAFVDYRFGLEEWVKLKPTAEFQICPILEIDGKKLSQTRAILRYLCMKEGLYPRDSKEIYLCESLCDYVDDIRLPLIDAVRTSDIEKMMQAKTALPQHLMKLESRLERGHSKLFYHGDAPGMADFMVFSFLWDNFLSAERKDDQTVKMPKALTAFAERMLENPKLRSYLETRAHRPY